MTTKILIGDCRAILRTLPANSVHCCVTSPPYFGLRDYGVAWQIGLEQTPAAFVAQMVAVFREVRRVLRDDGTLWLNLGDSYAGSWGARGRGKDTNAARADLEAKHGTAAPARNGFSDEGIKPKDLIGIPWRVAFALQDDGWYLRQDIIWHKPNPMPESVTDRCTKAHEYIFLMTKSPRYFYDAAAILEPVAGNANPRTGQNSALNVDRVPVSKKIAQPRTGIKNNTSNSMMLGALVSTRNKRSVWTVATAPFTEAHFATFPPALIDPCVLAGTSARGCCPKCGTGWQRVTAESDTGKTQKMPDGMATYAGSHTAVHKDGREKGEAGNPVMVTVTVGWYPGCECAGQQPLPAYPPRPSRAELANERAYKDAMREWRAVCVVIDGARGALCDDLKTIPTLPAVVLDPFGGAGTTGLVADRADRDAILIELNAEYAGIAERRINGDAGLFADVTSSKEEQADEKAD